VAGTDFDNGIATVAYESLHPFLPFEEQEGWHLDTENPLNGEYVIGSAIKLYEEQGVFQPDQHTWTDFSVANQFYQELVEHRDSASAIIEEMDAAGVSGAAADLLAQAKQYFDIFDYLDAARFAEAAKTAAG
jgi:hypothetical protein